MQGQYPETQDSNGELSEPEEAARARQFREEVAVVQRWQEYLREGYMDPPEAAGPTALVSGEKDDTPSE
jgi:hypothetical protein